MVRRENLYVDAPAGFLEEHESTEDGARREAYEEATAHIVIEQLLAVYNVPRISQKDNKAYKCTLCVDRVSVGQEPACVKTCPTGAINFGSKQDMLHQASERVTELQGRGFAGAGIYDPQGVGGTHVVYVLQHADKPHLYHKLPTDPRISSAIHGWKGWLKPVAAVAFFATLAGTLFHYVGVGPNEVEEQDEHIEEDTHA